MGLCQKKVTMAFYNLKRHSHSRIFLPPAQALNLVPVMPFPVRYAATGGHDDREYRWPPVLPESQFCC